MGPLGRRNSGVSNLPTPPGMRVEPAEEKSCIADVFSKPFEPLVPGLESSRIERIGAPNTETSLVMLLKKPWLESSSTTLNMWPEVGSTGWLLMYPFDQCAGGQVFTTVTRTNSFVFAERVVSDSNPVSDAGQLDACWYQADGESKRHTLVLPDCSNTLFRPVDNFTDTYWDGISDEVSMFITGENPVQLRSVAEDFGLMNPMAPPVETIVFTEMSDDTKVKTPHRVGPYQLVDRMQKRSPPEKERSPVAAPSRGKSAPPQISDLDLTRASDKLWADIQTTGSSSRKVYTVTKQ